MIRDMIWNDLPEVNQTEFSYKGQKDTDTPYPPAQIQPPFSVCTTTSEYLFDGVRFTSKKEWFPVPKNSHLLVFRQTIEPFGNIDFSLKSWMDKPGEDSLWKIREFQELENNACGWLLEDPSGSQALLCETTQILSVSMRVRESREECTHSYAVTAFEECPIKLEKYVSFHTSEEGPEFRDAAFRECRQASITGFEFLKGR